MSRSIHTTRRQLEALRRADYADPARRRERIRHISESLYTKRATKAQVRQERHQSEVPAGAEDSTYIPIDLYDQSPFIHYPAGIEDVRAVMGLLPPGTMAGVSRIVLCLGREAQHEESDDLQASGEPDPFAARPGVELLPGVFVGRCLGEYVRDSATICLYAYVYDAAAMPDRELRELYLRFQMLSTFVHEVAHHKGKLSEGTRGRWLVRPGEASERYARAYEYRWMQQVVARYLEQTYPHEVRALAEWMAYHGGVSLPLKLFADNCKNPFFNGSAAFEALVRAVDEGESLRETWFGFATDLYYANYYSEALRALSAILIEHPDDPEVVVLQARIYRNQEQYDEAERFAWKALAGDATCADAWWVLQGVYEARGDWPNLEVAATKRIELGDKQDAIYARVSRVRARIELGDVQGAETDIAALSAQVYITAQKKIKWLESSLVVLRALLFLRVGWYEEAFSEATAYLNKKRRYGKKWRYVWHKELLAVRFEAAHRLGRPAEAGALTAEDIARLRERGYGVWMDRLIADFGAGKKHE